MMEGRKESVLEHTLPVQGMEKREPEEPACSSETNPELPTTLPTCFAWLAPLLPGASGRGVYSPPLGLTRSPGLHCCPLDLELRCKAHCQ